MRKQLRVLVATADNLAGMGVCAALSEDPTLDLVHMPLRDMDTLLHVRTAHLPSILVLVSPNDSIEIVKLINLLAAGAEPLAIVVVAMSYDEACVRALLPLPTSGFLMITDPPELLRYALHTISLGSSWFATATMNRFYTNQQFQQIPSPQEQMLTQLTQREREVFLLLKRGENNKQIAKILSVTERTIRFHVRNIYDKLSFASRSEAIVWANQLPL